MFSSMSLGKKHMKNVFFSGRTTKVPLPFLDLSGSKHKGVSFITLKWYKTDKKFKKHSVKFKFENIIFRYLANILYNLFLLIDIDQFEQNMQFFKIHFSCVSGGSGQF